jgi:hypothetical protein
VVKILERLLLPFIRSGMPISKTQHGFAAGRSTVTALLPLVTMAANGFNENKPPSRTAVVALDISKAFDAVDHTLLIKKIASTPLHPNLIRWLATYLHGRSACCIYQSAKSPKMIIYSGTSQGGVTSPDIYNFFVSDFPEVAPLTESYADNFDVAELSPDVTTISTALTNDLTHISEWASRKNLSIAPNKSSVTLFTPDGRQSQCHPQAFLDDVLIPLKKNPKILGVTFDTFLNFSYHIKDIAVRLASLLQILKALAGTSWGQQKETLLITFKCLILSIINYAAPIWFPNASKTSIECLQVIHRHRVPQDGFHQPSPL